MSASIRSETITTYYIDYQGNKYRLVIDGHNMWEIADDYNDWDLVLDIYLIGELHSLLKDHLGESKQIKRLFK